MTNIENIFKNQIYLQSIHKNSVIHETHYIIHKTFFIQNYVNSRPAKHVLR